MNQLKPNIFTYATNELSHDAMLCWMLEWGKYEKTALYDLAKDFIRLMTQKEINITNLKIHKQYKKIDIIVEINNKYIIAIEDKVNTVEHSNQLNRYKTILQEDFSEAHRQNNIYLIYLTLNDECCFQYVNNKGYRVIKRTDMINLIKNYTNQSEILTDYYDHLIKIEQESNLYKSQRDITKWSDTTRIGFYSDLKENIIKSKSSWIHVNNPSGRFYIFSWDEHKLKYQNNIPYCIYLQIEKSRIVFKVKVDNPNTKHRSKIREYVWSKLKHILDENTEYVHTVEKTDFGNGRWMTIAKIDNIGKNNDILIDIHLAEKINQLLIQTILNKNNK